jgi:hypothetical protein
MNSAGSRRQKHLAVMEKSRRVVAMHERSDRRGGWGRLVSCSRLNGFFDVVRDSDSKAAL